MSWFKFSVNAHAHQKLRALTDYEFRLVTYIWALAQRSSRSGVVQLTEFEGVDSRDLASGAGVGNLSEDCPNCKADPSEALRRLKSVGLISVSRRGIITVHDWDEHNGRSPSKTREAQAAQKRAERSRKPENTERPKNVRRLSEQSPRTDQDKEKEQDQEKGKALSAKPTADGSPAPVPDADRVFEEWKKVFGKTNGALFTKDRERNVKARLKEGYSVERLFKAILGCKVSPHHQGKNDSGTVYDDLELICRTGTHVEKFESFVDKANGPNGGAPPVRPGAPHDARPQSAHEADAASGRKETRP